MEHTVLCFYKRQARTTKNNERHHKRKKVESLNRQVRLVLLLGATRFTHRHTHTSDMFETTPTPPIRKQNKNASFKDWLIITARLSLVEQPHTHQKSNIHLKIRCDTMLLEWLKSREVEGGTTTTTMLVKERPLKNDCEAYH